MLEFAQILEAIAKSSPIFLALIGWLYFTIKNLNKKEEDLANLNAEFRKSEKDNMQTLNAVNETLTKVINDASSNQDDVIKEIQGLKEYINLKFGKD